MARKSLSDFHGDTEKFREYLESAQCMQDDGIDVFVDEKGNIYTPTEGDWTKGHGHKNVFNGYNREPEDPKSYGRDWKNNYLELLKEIRMTLEEMNLIESSEMKLIRK